MGIQFEPDPPRLIIDGREELDRVSRVFNEVLSVSPAELSPSAELIAVTAYIDQMRGHGSDQLLFEGSQAEEVNVALRLLEGLGKVAI